MAGAANGRGARGLETREASDGGPASEHGRRKPSSGDAGSASQRAADGPDPV
jgi:hypothetical protein